MLAHRAAQRSFSHITRPNVLATTNKFAPGLAAGHGFGSRALTLLRPSTAPKPLNAWQRVGGARCFSQLGQFQMRPPGLKGRIWYKPDGTPRSKLKGLIVATLLGAASFTLWSALSVISDLDAANYILLCLIHIQRVDMEYPKTDLEDFRSLHAYFFALCSALFGDVPEEIIDSFCDDVFALPPASKEHAQQIMLEASNDVHTIIWENKGGWETAVKVVKRLEAALMDLGELMDDTDNTDEFVRLRTAKLKDINAVGEKSGKADDSYDIVG